MSAVDVEFPYLMEDEDRHGNPRVYVRRHGRRIRIREKRGTTAFARAYAEARDLLDERAGVRRADSLKSPVRGTLGWLASLYFASDEFKALAAQSQSTRRLILEKCLREPRKPGSPDLMRDCPLSVVSASHVLMLRDRCAGKPGAANNRLKYLSALFGWAIEKRHVTSNPARDVRPVKYATDGFHTWTPAEVEQFEKRHPIGTKARLALALLLFTGSRRGDVVTFGKQHIKDGWLRFIPNKTKYRRMDMSEKPVLPELARIIERSPCGEMTFLVTEYGQPFTSAGFGNWFRKRCDEAGLPHCSAHGLRKAGATRAAELGATDHQLMAMFDWTTPRQAAAYTKAASRKRMAGEAMQLLGHSENRNCPTESVPPSKALG